jgi:hypothetical protein
MWQAVTLEIRYAALAAALIVLPALNAQQPKELVPAPVPSQIATARKVFISNAGADPNSLYAFKRAGDPDEAYNGFYAAMQSWGRYELVSTPAESDLVFEIVFRAPSIGSGKGMTYEPQSQLTIVDTKTHFTLWTLSAGVQGAYRKATWLKNFDQGLNALIDDLKKVSGPSAAGVDPQRK